MSAPFLLAGGGGLKTMPTRADIQANKEQVFFDENEISLSGVSFELVTQNCKLIMVHGKRN